MSPGGRRKSEHARRNLLMPYVLRLTSAWGFSTIAVDFSGRKWILMADLSVFRGNSPARIDDRGRLKVPGDFRGPLESRYGRELFVTSLTGEYVRIYPMPVWQEIEQKLGAMPTTHPSRVRFLERANYFGQVGEIDAQGRVLLPVRLREADEMTGDVD